MKNLLCLVLLAFLITSCLDFGQDYKYTYTTKITYTDSEVDTITFSYNSFHGNNVYVNLKITDSGLISSYGISPSLIVGCGFRQKVIACGVRNYEILKETKLALNNVD